MCVYIYTYKYMYIFFFNNCPPFQLCEYCKRLGATILCHAEGCLPFYHFPCSVASGSLKQLALLCPEHIDDAQELGKETSLLFHHADNILIVGVSFLMANVVCVCLGGEDA